MPWEHQVFAIQLCFQRAVSMKMYDMEVHQRIPVASDDNTLNTCSQCVLVSSCKWNETLWFRKERKSLCSLQSSHSLTYFHMFRYRDLPTKRSLDPGLPAGRWTASQEKTGWKALTLSRTRKEWELDLFPFPLLFSTSLFLIFFLSVRISFLK